MTTVLNEQQAAEILARQVAEDLDVGNVPAGKVIFEGQIMDRTIVAKIIDERVVKHNSNALFDLYHSIDDHIEAGPVRVRLKTNLFWGLTARVIGAARNVMYDMPRIARECGHIDSFNEYLTSISAAQFSSDYTEIMGYAHNSSGMNRLRALGGVLSDQRQRILAEAVAQGVPTKNLLPDIFEMAKQEPEIDGETMAKAMLVAEVMNEGGTEEDLVEAKALVTAKLQEDLKRKRDNAVIELPLLQRLLSDVIAEHKETSFHELDNETQAALIAGAIRTLQKLPEALTKARSISVTDLMMALPQIKRLRARLSEVASDPRFAE